MNHFVSKWIRRWEPVLTHLFLTILPKKPSLHSSEKHQSILVVKSCCLGDAILSLYGLREFRRLNPNCRIEVLVTSRVDEVYRSVSFVDSVHVLPITGFNLGRELLSLSLLGKTLRLLQLLRQKKFQCLIDMELYRTFGPLLARILGIPRSQGFAVPGAPSKAHDVRVFRSKTEPEWKCFYALLGLPPPSQNPAPLYLNSRNDPAKNVPQIGLV
jgi:ADP-heptose:LPS heptosyltransferase